MQCFRFGLKVSRVCVRSLRVQSLGQFVCFDVVGL